MLPLLYNFIYQSSRIAQTIVSRHYCGCEGVFCTHMIPLVDIKRFIADCFISLGATDSNAEIVADGLVNTDYMGEVKYGVSQLENYIKSVDDHTCNPKAQPQIEEEHTSVAVVNGNNGFGHVTAKFCMDVAMEKALTTGIGMVAAKGSNPYGIGSLYTVQAAKKGFIGLSFTNAVPEVVPAGAIQAALGKNPFSLAAPAHCEALIVDIPAATAETTPKKRYSYDDLNIQLPRAWTLNKNIKLDIGEKPLTGQQDYKNIGTNLLVEVLTGILADSNCGPNIPIQKDSKEKNKKREPLNLGHNFIAINPEMFVPNFATRLSRFLNRLRNLEMLDPTKKIDLPGDKQRQHMKKVDCAGGTLCFHRTQLLALENISKRLGVPPLELSLYTQGPYEKSKGSPELDLS